MMHRLSACCFLLVLCASLLAWPCRAAGSKDSFPDLVDKKLRILAEALQARDKGDMPLARSRLEALKALGASDAQVLRLEEEFAAAAQREKLRAEEARRQEALPARTGGFEHLEERQSPGSTRGTEPVMSLPVSPLPPLASPIDAFRSEASASVALDALVAAENERQAALIERSQERLRLAKRLSFEARHKEALEVLRGVGDDLPRNRVTLSLIQELDATLVDLQHRLRVAELSPGAEAPSLSLRHGEVPAGAPPLDLYLHLLEVPAGVIDDLWRAWEFYFEDSRDRVTKQALVLADGREQSLHRPGQSPTERQRGLMEAMRQAGALPVPGAPLKAREGSVGVVASLDPAPLIQALSRLDACRVLGSPHWQGYLGQETILTLLPEASRTRTAPDAPGELKAGWEIRVQPDRTAQEGWMELSLSPRITRYEGFVLGAAHGKKEASPGNASLPVSKSQPVYSRHELSTRIVIPDSSTLMLAGLVWDDGSPEKRQFRLLHQFPVVGHYLGLREVADRQTALLVFLSARPAAATIQSVH